MKIPTVQQEIPIRMISKGEGVMIIRRASNVKQMCFDMYTIMVNMDKKSWVKLTNSAVEIINKIEDKTEEEAFFTLESIYEVTREDAAEFIDYLLEMGVIIKQKEKQYITILNDNIEEKNNIAHCYLHVTRRCNLNCGYCSIDANQDNKDLTTNQVRSIIRKLSINKINQLVFSGGEPLLRDDLEELVLYAKKMIPDIGLVSNGTLITEKNAEFIAKNFDKIQISLDSGIEEIHDLLRGKGSFSKTVNGIQLLKEYGHQNIKITPTVNQLNIKNIEEIVKIAKDLDLLMEARFVLPTGRGEQNQDEFCIQYKDMYEAYLRIWKECERLDFKNYSVKEFYDKYMRPTVSCGVCKSKLCIDVNGDIYPCAYMMNEEVKIGNIFEQTNLREIVRKSKIGTKIANFDVDHIHKCKDCEVRYFCGGGCMAIRYGNTGEIDGDGMDCAYYRKLFGQLIWEASDNKKESLLQVLGLREES